MSASASDTGTETGAEVEGLEQHGTVRVQVVPVDDDPAVFEDTAGVRVTVHYLACLESFYLGAGTSWKQTGTKGAPVFEAFADTLCADSGGSVPDCSVAAISSTVDSGANDFVLSVDYAIADVATLSAGEFIVGPLPLEALAGCEPVVQVRSMGVSGRDAQGNQLWRVGTISGDNEATSGDLVALRVEIVPQ